jgi:hypothetical protein
MFAQKLKLTILESDGETLVPMAWLDQFFMRSFTGSSAFDETLPVADGLLEASLRVAPCEVKAQFEKWLRGRKTIGAAAELRVEIPAGGEKLL